MIKIRGKKIRNINQNLKLKIQRVKGNSLINLYVIDKNETTMVFQTSREYLLTFLKKFHFGMIDTREVNEKMMALNLKLHPEVKQKIKNKIIKKAYAVRKKISIYCNIT